MLLIKHEWNNAKIITEIILFGIIRVICYIHYFGCILEFLDSSFLIFHKSLTQTQIGNTPGYM